ncbi:DUF2336 domain-containing protein [Skermanella pratensis]|uniref:DUF2336 domain-containing protein n=1 Tax=Skermanella pratensis TaxID=2233999 RepID=UPI001300F8C6|nr:DUF2336 domain-containing protein [Skermanella pratensis]
MHSAMPSTPPTNLSLADVARLMDQPSVANRIDTAGKVAEQIRQGGLSGSAADMAADILMRFAQDAEVAVRQAVAWQFRNNDRLPESLAIRLAEDVAEVAAPVLSHHAGFEDAFLTTLIGKGDQRKMEAIAGRPSVSTVVSDALIDAGDVAVVSCLLANSGAEIAPDGFGRIVDRHGDHQSVATMVAHHPMLPAPVAWKLLGRVSAAVTRDLARRHKIPDMVLERCITRGREAAMMIMIRPMLADGAHLRGFLEQMHWQRQLTTDLLFRMLCAGDLEAFITGMAVRCGVTREAAAVMVMDERPAGLRAAFDQAGMKGWLMEPFRIALGVARRWPRAALASRRRDFQIEVLAHVFAECADTEERDVSDLILQVFDLRGDRSIAEARDRLNLPSPGAR